MRSKSSAGGFRLKIQAGTQFFAFYRFSPSKMCRRLQKLFSILPSGTVQLPKKILYCAPCRSNNYAEIGKTPRFLFPVIESPETGNFQTIKIQGRSAPFLEAPRQKSGHFFFPTHTLPPNYLPGWERTRYSRLLTSRKNKLSTINRKGSKIMIICGHPPYAGRIEVWCGMAGTGQQRFWSPPILPPRVSCRIS